MLEAEMQQVRQELAALRSSVAEITRMRHEARGGWRAVAFLFPVVSALCAAAALLLRLRL
jgi:prefoldin subunit 5